jgi:hypothetical protein
MLYIPYSMGSCGSKKNKTKDHEKNPVGIHHDTHFIKNQKTVTFDKEIKLLCKILNDPKMTLQKLIMKLTTFLTRYLGLIIFGGAIMTKYSRIPTNNLNIAYYNFSARVNFIGLFNVIQRITADKSILKFIQKIENIEYYTLKTCNGTKLKIDLVDWQNIMNLPPDFKEASLIMDKNGIHRRTGVSCRNSPYCINDNHEEIKQILSNLKSKTLTCYPARRIKSKSEAVIFKINRLKRIVKKINQGYTINETINKFNIRPLNILSDTIDREFKFVPLPIINIISEYAVDIDNDGWYAKNAICCWCSKKFIDEECFKPSCACDCDSDRYESPRWDCIVHYFVDGTLRDIGIEHANKEKLMITNPNLLWHYECYEDVYHYFQPKMK